MCPELAAPPSHHNKMTRKVLNQPFTTKKNLSMHLLEPLELNNEKGVASILEKKDMAQQIVEHLQ